MESISTIRSDFVTSNLRSQLNRLQDILNNIEEINRVDWHYADITLREIEVSLRRIRKICSNNN